MYVSFSYEYYCYVLQKIKNKIRKFEPKNGPKFKNTQAELKILCSYIKKPCNQMATSLFTNDFVLKSE